MLRATAVVVLLTTVRYAAAEEQLRDHFVVRSPNGRFEATFDQMAMPPFTIRETGTNKPMMSLDEERFCGRGAEASWAPDSTKLVLLAHCRFHDRLWVCRLNTTSIPYFHRSDTSRTPHDSLTLGNWTRDTTLKVRVEKHIYTLRITDDHASFSR